MQLEGGTLGTKWVDEMLPKRDAPVPIERFGAPADQFRLDEAHPRVRLERLPKAYHLSLSVDPAAGGMPAQWRIVVRGRSDGESGYEIRFRPAEEMVEFRDSPGDAPHGSQHPLPHGLVERFPGLDQRHTVDLLVFDNLVDICIAGRYTHLGFAPEEPDALTIERLGGALGVDTVTLHPPEEKQ